MAIKSKAKAHTGKHTPHAGQAVHTSLVRALTSLGIRQGLLESAKLAFARAIEGVADRNYGYAVRTLERLAYDATVIREAERAKRRQLALARPAIRSRSMTLPNGAKVTEARPAAPLQPAGKLRAYAVSLYGKLSMTVMARNADEALALAKARWPEEIELSGSNVNPQVRTTRGAR